jgi:hypothetical protein
MIEPNPRFFKRLVLSLKVFWRTLVDPDFAVQVARLTQGALPSPHVVIEAERMALKDTSPDSALQLLGLFQQEGRLVDFLEEDVSRYSDAEIGAAARVVHEGCRRVLHDHLQIESVRGEEEGARLTLDAGFNASAVRLTGNVVGRPPFHGKLVHRGWRVSEIKLPKLADGHDTKIVAPAEVEL